MKGKHILIEGIDGSGKSTLVKGLQEHFKNTGKQVFSMKEYLTEKGTFPDEQEIKKHFLITSAEPTKGHVGKIIRNELITKENNRVYTNETIAHAYAMDRAIHYQCVVLPALEAGVHIIQDRSVISTFFYQILSTELSEDEAVQHPYLQFEGNKLALTTIPDMILVASLNPETALQRCEKRDAQQDIYENLTFQKRLTAMYNNKQWYKRLFGKDVVVVFLDTEEPHSEKAIKKAIQIVEKIL